MSVSQSTTYVHTSMGTSTTSTNDEFELGEEVLKVLPTDPFEQLDVARKITSIALSTRVSALESELSALRAAVADKDDVISDLNSQVNSLLRDKENLVKDNSALSNTVAKLGRDVSKLEVFKKTLMQSLQEEEDNPALTQETIGKQVSAQSSLPVAPLNGDDNGKDDDISLPPSASTQSENVELGNSLPENHDPDSSRPRISQGLLLASQMNTPRFTPPGSPPIMSASASPTKTSKPASPRRHSVSFSTTRGMFDSLPSSTNSSFSSSGAGSGRPRTDGKEFFRQVRSRLSYEQFGAFLSNVKELNSHKQTKEETLRKAEEIFGVEYKDLYTTFEALLNRNPH